MRRQGYRQGQPAKERIMDLKNNTVGIACGDFSAKCSDACIEKYNTGQLFGLDGIKADNPIEKQSKGVQMLQIIRGKLVIFLITLCLFVVYLGFDNNSNSNTAFYGHKTPKSVEIYLSEKNIIYKIINDQKISRGNGHFIR
ncbi:hypothetical protein ACLB1S_06285 [Escherichia coli]